MERDNKTDGHKHEDSTVTMQSLPQKLKIFKVKSEVKRELTCISYVMKRKFGEIQETIQEQIAITKCSAG